MLDIVPASKEVFVKNMNTLFVEDLDLRELLSKVTIYTDSAIMLRKPLKRLDRFKMSDDFEDTVEVENVVKMMKNCGKSDCATCKYYIAVGMWQTYWANR